MNFDHHAKCRVHDFSKILGDPAFDIGHVARNANHFGGSIFKLCYERCPGSHGQGQVHKLYDLFS